MINLNKLKFGMIKIFLMKYNKSLALVKSLNIHKYIKNVNLHLKKYFLVVNDMN
jgi:hypothetical protein